MKSTIATRYADFRKQHIEPLLQRAAQKDSWGSMPISSLGRAEGERLKEGRRMVNKSKTKTK